MEDEESAAAAGAAAGSCAPAARAAGASPKVLVVLDPCVLKSTTNINALELARAVRNAVYAQLVVRGSPHGPSKAELFVCDLGAQPEPQAQRGTYSSIRNTLVAWEKRCKSAQISGPAPDELLAAADSGARGGHQRTSAQRARSLTSVVLRRARAEEHASPCIPLPEVLRAATACANAVCARPPAAPGAWPGALSGIPRDDGHAREDASSFRAVWRPPRKHRGRRGRLGGRGGAHEPGAGGQGRGHVRAARCSVRPRAC